jgi:DNA-binding beta-propeller fold protein YncE
MTKIADAIQLFNCPGPKPNGLQATDEGLWVVDQGNDFVYLLDWNDGRIIKSFKTDTDKSSGITVDDKGNLWVASTYNCKIYKIDCNSGKTIKVFDSPGQGMNATREHDSKNYQNTGDHGLEWKDGLLYVASPPSQYIHVMDPESWIEKSKTKVPGYRVHGIAWAEEEGKIWAADTAMGVISKIRLSDGRVYDTFRVPHPIQVHGMTIKDNVLWYCDDRRPIGTLSVSMEPDF